MKAALRKNIFSYSPLTATY